MSMLEDFYPTPSRLIWKMLEGVKLDQISTILEPSAGKGDICDVVADKPAYTTARRTVDVIEINPDLQHVLKGKGYNLVQDDFLTFDTRKCYDLIIANFPFSDGDRHLAHAISLIERNGGRLVCLVNAETIRNPHTKVRKLIEHRLDLWGAEVEFLPGEFVKAERSTNVEVALVRVSVNIEPTFSLILDGLHQAKQRELDERPEADLIERDFKRAMVARFNLECEAGAGLIDEYFALKPHILDRMPPRGDQSDYRSPLIELKIKDCTGRDVRSHLINSYLRGVRHKYWEILINDPRYTGQYTTNIKDDLDRKLSELRECDFNLFNIEQLAKDLGLRVTKGVEDAILKLFDTLSRNFAWDESVHQKNVHYYNGWKTNKAWKINHKVILPMNGISAEWGNKYRFQYRINQELSDMVKVFNYLAPEKTDVLRLVGKAMEDAEAGQNFTNVDFRYFETTFYKKGTCHIRFKDKDLLDKFNIFGSQRKGWLPPAYGKRPYEDLDRFERETVDTFQGKDEYARVMADTDYFIVDDAKGLLTSGEGF